MWLKNNLKDKTIDWLFSKGWNVRLCYNSMKYKNNYCELKYIFDHMNVILFYLCYYNCYNYYYQKIIRTKTSQCILNPSKLCKKS